MGCTKLTSLEFDQVTVSKRVILIFNTNERWLEMYRDPRRASDVCTIAKNRRTTEVDQQGSVVLPYLDISSSVRIKNRSALG